MQKQRTQITRREFLRTAGLTSSYLAAAPLFNTSAAAEIPRVERLRLINTDFRIAVLIPETPLYPELGRQLLAGMSVYLEEHPLSLPIKLTTISTGIGGGAMDPTRGGSIKKSLWQFASHP